MGSTTPNMNITAVILTNITGFGRFAYTLVLVAFNVGEFPDIRRVMTSIYIKRRSVRMFVRCPQFLKSY